MTQMQLSKMLSLRRFIVDINVIFVFFFIGTLLEKNLKDEKIMLFEKARVREK